MYHSTKSPLSQFLFYSTALFNRLLLISESSSGHLVSEVSLPLVTGLHPEAICPQGTTTAVPYGCRHNKLVTGQGFNIE
ncbi:unnamed protein product [Caenorhabditis nigoni]